MIYTTHTLVPSTKILSILTTGFTAVLLSTVTVSVHAKDISPSTAHYTFSVKDTISGSGKAVRTIKKTGNTWSYKTRASALGGVAKANQQSIFTMNKGNVKPNSAKTTYKAMGIGNTHKISFNKNSVLSTYKNKRSALSMPQQAFDDLSLEVQIRQDLLNNRFTGNYYIVKKKGIEKTKFKKSGMVNVTTKAGTFKTVRIDKINKNSSKQTTFWLAPSLDYLPIKVVQKDGKNNMKLELIRQQ